MSDIDHTQPQGAHLMPPMPSSPPLGPSDTYQVDSDDFITDEESMHPDEYDQLVTEGELEHRIRSNSAPVSREGGGDLNLRPMSLSLYCRGLSSRSSRSRGPRPTAHGAWQTMGSPRPRPASGLALARGDMRGPTLP